VHSIAGGGASIFRAVVRHVLLASFTPMLQSIIVDALSGRDDISLTISDRAEASASCGDVDVVLAAAPDLDHVNGLIELLRRWPKSRLVVVSTSGRDAVLYELVPQKQMLGDVCPATLVAAICGERR
jgi:hypothetical protein